MTIGLAHIIGVFEKMRMKNGSGRRMKKKQRKIVYFAASNPVFSCGRKLNKTTCVGESECISATYPMSDPPEVDLSQQMNNDYYLRLEDEPLHIRYLQRYNLNSNTFVLISCTFRTPYQCDFAFVILRTRYKFYSATLLFFATVINCCHL